MLCVPDAVTLLDDVSDLHEDDHCSAMSSREGETLPSAGFAHLDSKVADKKAPKRAKKWDSKWRRRWVRARMQLRRQQQPIQPMTIGRESRLVPERAACHSPGLPPSLPFHAAYARYRGDIGVTDIAIPNVAPDLLTKSLKGFYDPSSLQIM